jgi:hypothetical protein
MTDSTVRTASARFTVRELVDEAQREAFMRRRYFEKSVKSGRMSRAEADRRIDLMEAIATRLLKTAHV